MTPGRIAALALAPLSLALAMPGALAQDDPRLISHEYNAGEIVKIRGKLGVQATIAFDEAEQIENVAVGDSQKWQITPNKRANLLFVKPLEVAAVTNMTVVTNKRTYLFDLVASPRERPVYMFRFTYDGRPKPVPVPAPPAEAAPAIAARPAEEPAAARPEARQGASAAFVEAFTSLPAAEPEPPPATTLLSFAWQRSGDAAVLPVRVWDNGTVTFLSWSGSQAMPSIFTANESGEESAAIVRLADSTAIVQSVPSRIVLRSETASATLDNISAKRKLALAAPQSTSTAAPAEPVESTVQAEPAVPVETPGTADAPPTDELSPPVDISAPSAPEAPVDPVPPEPEIN